MFLHKFGAGKYEVIDYGHGTADEEVPAREKETFDYHGGRCLKISDLDDDQPAGGQCCLCYLFYLCFSDFILEYQLFYIANSMSSQLCQYNSTS